MNADHPTGRESADSRRAERVARHENLVAALFRIARLLDATAPTTTTVKECIRTLDEAKDAFRQWHEAVCEAARERFGSGEAEDGEASSDEA